MNQNTVIGLAAGLLVGYLLWRNRGAMVLSGAGAGCGGCAGCGGGDATGTAAASAPGACGQRWSAGPSRFYPQQTGPTLQGWGSR